MKKYLIVICGIGAGIAAWSSVRTDQESAMREQPVIAETASPSLPEPITETIPPVETLSLPARRTVPFAVQAPAGTWQDPVFQNGCEEASILMAAHLGRTDSFSIEEMKREIRRLSKLSVRLFGTAVDTSAKDTLALFQEYTGRTDGELLDPATDDRMRSVLASGRILIVPMDGQMLRNPHFTAPGPETHMLVVTGYDAATEEYITHDPGTRFGEGYRYPVAKFIRAMRDYPTGDHLPIGSVAKRAIAIGQGADRE